MKVVHINTNSSGGAAKAAIRIHRAMLKKGIDSKILFLRSKNLTEPESYTFYDDSLISKIKDFLNRLRHLIYSKFDTSIPVSLPFNIYDLTQNALVINADIIHLHWVSKFLDYSFFQKINKPIVWTLHDMAPFTGGNHYKTDFDDDKFKKIIDINLNYKKNALKNFKKMKIVTPSKWLSNESKKSEIFGEYQHYIVRNTIDFDVFKKLSKSELRSKFHFSVEDKIIIFIAEKITDNRKGISYFLGILDELIAQNIKIILIGKSKLGIASDNIISFGNIDDEVKIAELYNIADVFVITSIEDNFPNTILESMSCGTPVVGFDNTGINELIVHKENGYLAKDRDKKDLLQGINYVLENHTVLSNNAIVKAVENCNSQKVINDYLNVYNQFE